MKERVATARVNMAGARRAAEIVLTSRAAADEQLCRGSAFILVGDLDLEFSLSSPSSCAFVVVQPCQRIQVFVDPEDLPKTIKPLWPLNRYRVRPTLP